MELLRRPLQAPAPRERVTPVSMPLALLSAWLLLEMPWLSSRWEMLRATPSPTSQELKLGQPELQINDLTRVLFFCPMFSYFLLVSIDVIFHSLCLNT